MMSSCSWSFLALCKWKVLYTRLQSTVFTIAYDLGNISVGGGVEVFKLACPVGKADVIGID